MLPNEAREFYDKLHDEIEKKIYLELVESYLNEGIIDNIGNGIGVATDYIKSGFSQKIGETIAL